MTRLNDMKDYQMSTGNAYHGFLKLPSDNYFSWCASMESVLRSLNHDWDLPTSRMCHPRGSYEEVQLEKAWDLCRVWAYTEIDIHVVLE
jgi:hypothetical protein